MLSKPIGESILTPLADGLYRAYQISQDKTFECVCSVDSLLSQARCLQAASVMTARGRLLCRISVCIGPMRAA